LKKLIVIGIIVVALSAYFALTVFVLPEKFIAKEQFVPNPYLEVELSSTDITLGESFRLSTISENKGDYGDIHIVSAAFPTVENIENVVRIVSYDFSSSPHYIESGEEIGAEYSGGLETVSAQYPSIEAMNRPVHPGTKYVMDLQITPDEVGEFTVYLKSIDIPHSSSISHFPQDGQLDHQGEYVQVYTVNVNP
jgi:hypothetical protein